MQNKNLEKNFIGIMPMAGEGLRFKKHGYVLPKPLIKINNTPMFLKAAKSFPKNLGWVFVTNKSIATNYNIIEKSKKEKKNIFLFLKKKTQGQASTVYKSLKYINKMKTVIVHSCDLSFKLNFNFLKKKIIENDLLVFTSKGTNYQFKNHKHFSWVKNSQNRCEISLKKKFSKNNNAKVLIGTFVFKNKKILKNLLEYTFKKKMKINNEYYMDTLMLVANKLGYKISEFVVDKYVSWGSHKEFLNYKKND